MFHDNEDAINTNEFLEKKHNNNDFTLQNVKFENEISFTSNNITKDKPQNNFDQYECIKLEENENSYTNSNIIKEEYVEYNNTYQDLKLENDLLLLNNNTIDMIDVKKECAVSSSNEDEQVDDSSYSLDFVKDEPQIAFSYEDRDKEETCENNYIFTDNGFESNSSYIKNEILYCDSCQEPYELFCSECQMLQRLFDNCIKMESKDREFKTIPKNILEIRKCIDGKGVFALKNIPKGVIFGPYTGIRKTLKNNLIGNKRKLQKGKLVEDDKVVYRNWLCFVNQTKDMLNYNLYAFQHGSHLYYRSNRKIFVGEELLVYLGKESLGEMGVFRNPVEETIENVYGCIPCCLGFTSETYLRQHQFNCIFTTENKSFIKFTQCTFCSIYLDSEFLQYHTKYNCVRKKEISDINETTNNYECHNCSTTFTHKSNLKRHMLRHYREKYHHCNYCDYKSTRSDCLLLHTKNVHFKTATKKFKCPTCDYRTNRTTDLKKHINLHNGIKEFKCDICEKEFTEKGSLKRHILIHTDQKPYQCDVCQYRCRQKGSLVKHKKTHTGDRPNICHLCGRKFLEKCKLQRHMKVHQERNYKCSVSLSTVSIQSRSFIILYTLERN